MKYNPSDSNHLDFLSSFKAILSSKNIAEEEQFTIRSSTVHALKNRSHTGRRLGTHINKHKLAIRRRDPLSLVFAHAVDYDRRFNWEGTEVVAMASTKQAREFLEAWPSGKTVSTATSIWMRI
ncbi:unnamed protein product, partial [Schistocephalus solidus]|uniref:Uncharacterized protein n=1 Tax=Schistocephalus solidus TaxID=70667 RepID=A0A183TIR1_SCHSO